MISGTYTVQINATTETVWTYLADFGNWAPYVVGYEGLRTVDAETTVWTLRGDVGVLSRQVDLEVKVLEWEPGTRAAFSITGITERLDGTGSFELHAVTAEESGEESGEDVPTADVAVVEPRQSWWRRFTRRMALRMLRRARAKSGAAAAAAVGAAPGIPVPRDAPTGGEQCALTFTLDVSPGGPMAPMVEMLMRPLLEPAAEDLSTQIREQVEGASRV